VYKVLNFRINSEPEPAKEITLSRSKKCTTIVNQQRIFLKHYERGRVYHRRMNKMFSTTGENPERVK
jgi:hypothetical protein